VRYRPDHKAKARAALLQSGARSLKTSGFNGIGVNDLAAAAGVTSGGFYSNFANKEAMLEAVIEAFVGEPFVSETDTASASAARSRLRALVDDYISAHHSADPAEGCPIPALSADVARAQPSVQEAYEGRITAFAHRIAGLLDGAPSDRERRAWSVLALMVGAITISRAMPEDSESKTTSLEAARRTARRLIDTDPTRASVRRQRN